MKKVKIENTIRKHQDELKILEETMENISDGMCLDLILKYLARFKAFKIFF